MESQTPPELPTTTNEPIPTETVEVVGENEEEQIQTISIPDDTPMVVIPGGPFEMGSDADPLEQPIHTVTLDEFQIDQFEVTNARYALCVEAAVCDPPADVSSSTLENYFDNPEYGEYPVIYVNWNQAKRYCEWREGRLPTEAEWEKAARGTDERTYPWGDDFDGTRLNFCDTNCPYGLINDEFDDGHSDTAPVGSYPEGVSPYEVHDMAGNVWEWVHDGLGERYYASSPAENPPGPANAAWKIIRGGSWSGTLEKVRTTERQTEEGRARLR
ncbi:MAG: SUMF1/EgtB/PvdO family nonheme iron enzyme, partial [Chloroflexota bacterium]